MKKVLIVDAYNLFIRHYVAHPAMSNNGEQIGGVVGFFYSVSNLTERFRPDEVVIVWEGGGSNKKRGLYSDYKKSVKPQKLNRYYDDIPDTTSNRNFQIKLLINLFKNVPVKQVYVSECEADDAIGFMCRYLRKDDIKLILSSDHDYYQLINERTKIWSPTLKALVDDKKVIDRYNIHPLNYCLAKSIVGDKSDNIAGVKGAGFKTLANNFEKFILPEDYYLEDFFEDNKLKSESSTKKLFQNILKSETLIQRNWRLTYLDVQNVSHDQVEKIKYSLENNELSFDKMSTLKLLLNHGINNLNIDRAFINFKLLRN